MFCDFLRSSKLTPPSDENPSTDEKAFNVFDVRIPSDPLPGEFCCCCCCCWWCCCCKLRIVAANSELFCNPSKLEWLVKSNIDSSSASFSRARSFIACECVSSLSPPDDSEFSIDGDMIRSFSSKIDDMVLGGSKEFSLSLSLGYLLLVLQLFFLSLYESSYFHFFFAGCKQRKAWTYVKSIKKMFSTLRTVSLPFSALFFVTEFFMLYNCPPCTRFDSALIQLSLHFKNDNFRFFSAVLLFLFFFGGLRERV